MDEISPITTDRTEADRRHLIHPLHHPKDHANARLFVRGEGAMLYTANGREYIDGLAALWNVNAGHGRKELAAIPSAAPWASRISTSWSERAWSSEPRSWATASAPV